MTTILNIIRDYLPYILFGGFLLVTLFLYYLLAAPSTTKEKMPSKARSLKLPSSRVVYSETYKQVAAPSEAKPQLETKAKVKVVASNEETEFSAIKYSYSTYAQISLAPAESQKRYASLKGELLRFSGMKSSLTWREERFIYNGKTIAKIRLIGNVLRLYLSLPYAHVQTINIKSEDLSKLKEHAMTPSLIRISGNTGLKRAYEALSLLAEHHNLEIDEQYTEEEFTGNKETFDSLLAAGFIRSV